MAREGAHICANTYTRMPILSNKCYKSLANLNASVLVVVVLIVLQVVVLSDLKKTGEPFEGVVKLLVRINKNMFY